MGSTINMDGDFVFFQKVFYLICLSLYEDSMMKKVIEKPPKSLRIDIDSLSKRFDIPNVGKIQKELKDMLDNPKNYTCLSEDYIDKMFGNWIKPSPGNSHAPTKETVIRIKEKMFQDNSDCPEIKDSD